MTKKRQDINSETKEKIFLVVFLIFAIAVIILLFKNPTGFTTISTKLDATSYNPGDDINGMISVQLQEGDLLPEDTSIKILIKANASKCPLNYVCSNDKTVPWYEIDETGACVIKEPDPEGACCLAFPSDCYQRIVNSGFDDEIKFWNPKIYHIGGFPEPYGIDYWDIYIDEEFDFSPEAAFTDSSGTRLEDSYVALRHNLGTKRDLIISQLKCVENWQCTNWGRCGPCPPGAPTGKQSRTCTDLNACGTTANKPVITQACPCITPVETGPPLYGSSSNTFQPDLQFSNGQPIYESSKGLRYMFYWETEEAMSCAFEVVVKGKSEAKTERNLHFYHTLDGCPRPLDTTTDKYINMGTPEMYELHIIEADLYSEWIGKGWSENDVIEEIWLVSRGDKEGEEIKGQFVLWDNIELVKYGAPDVSINCSERSTRKNPKVCCREDTGIGSYYGEQLNCSAGYECWSKCADSLEFSLREFEKKRTTEGRGKYNKTGEGFAKAIVNDAEIELEEWLDKGDGYSACLDTSSTSSIRTCRGWDNIYSSEIQSLTSRTEKFEAPKQPGAYEFIFRLEYLPEGWPPECLPEEEEWGYCGPILIDEKSILFNVAGEDGICIPNWIDCKNITKCDSTTNYKEILVVECTDENQCGEPCPPELCIEWGPTNKTCEPELTPCTEVDYDIYDWCDDWEPSPCRPDESQTRNCEADPSICNVTHSGAEVPDLERDCTLDAITEYASEQQTRGVKRSSVEKELSLLDWSNTEIKMVLDGVYGKEERATWWIWVLLIVVIAAAAVLLMLRMKKRPRVKKAAVPPELFSYIKDAIAAGSTKAEIATKLVQAGWPRESVDAAIKTLK